jgi:hypothetical protein
MSFSSHVIASFRPGDKDVLGEACVALAADGMMSHWKARGGLLRYKPCGPYGAWVSRKVLSPALKHHRQRGDTKCPSGNLSRDDLARCGI